MKIILRTLMGLVIGLTALVLLVLIQDVNPVNKDPGLARFVFPDTLAGQSLDLDSLRDLVGPSKVLPPGAEVQALLALSAYPQLRDVRITMTYRPYGPPMQANFNIPTLLGSAGNREYIIHLNDDQSSFMAPILLPALPFDAQVGILAHELGHIAYYHQLNTLQIARWGLNYLMNPDFRATHEKTTDLMPVYHGLGSQIWQYAHHVRHNPCCQPMYARNQEWIDRYYLTDEEIMTAWRSYRLSR